MCKRTPLYDILGLPKQLFESNTSNVSAHKALVSRLTGATGNRADFLLPDNIFFLYKNNKNYSTLPVFSLISHNTEKSAGFIR